MRTTLKTMPSETVGAGRIAELVEQIESAVVARDFCWRLMDQYSPRHPDYRAVSDNAERFDHSADRKRAELRAIIGCDPYRLANAIGA